MQLSTTIVGYLLLFAVGGFGFVLFNILAGSFLRPKNPEPEKLEIYECGEPTIGSSFVQFDLRFYVVALLFIIFDVEVAFFFPWAVVFGKATQLAQYDAPAIVETASGPQVGPAYFGLMSELGVPVDADALLVQADQSQLQADTVSSAMKLVWTCMADMAVFFAVLLIGFAYVWKRGDLDWVRSIAGHASASKERSTSWQESSKQVASRV